MKPDKTKCFGKTAFQSEYCPQIKASQLENAVFAFINAVQIINN